MDEDTKYVHNLQEAARQLNIAMNIAAQRGITVEIRSLDVTCASHSVRCVRIELDIYKKF